MFDPFQDFETAGYLRNKFAEKDPEMVQELEHQMFRASLDEAIAHLAKRRGALRCEDLLAVHRHTVLQCFSSPRPGGAVWVAIMGLGVAALAPRMLPWGVVEVGAKLGLPELPRLPVLLHSRVKDPRSRDALCALAAALRSAVRR